MTTETMPSYVVSTEDTTWVDTAKMHEIKASLGISKSYQEVVSNRLRTDLDTLLATDDALARDLALFGDARPIEDILKAYNLEAYELEEKLRDDTFSSKVRMYRSIADKDHKAFTRIRAGILTDALLEQVYRIATTADRDSDKLAAIRLLATLADAMPKDNKGGEAKVSPNFVFNFGDSPHSNKLAEIASGNTYDADTISAE